MWATIGYTVRVRVKYRGSVRASDFLGQGGCMEGEERPGGKCPTFLPVTCAARRVYDVTRAPRTGPPTVYLRTTSHLDSRYWTLNLRHIIIVLR